MSLYRVPNQNRLRTGSFFSWFLGQNRGICSSVMEWWITPGWVEGNSKVDCLNGEWLMRRDWWNIWLDMKNFCLISTNHDTSSFQKVLLTCTFLALQQNKLVQKISNSSCSLQTQIVKKRTILTKKLDDIGQVCLFYFNCQLRSGGESSNFRTFPKKTFINSFRLSLCRDLK